MLYCYPFVVRGGLLQRLLSAITAGRHDEFTQSWSEPCQSPLPQAQSRPVHLCTPSLQVTQNPLLPCWACIHINPGLWSFFLKQITSVLLSTKERNKASCLSFWAQPLSRICSLSHAVHSSHLGWCSQLNQPKMESNRYPLIFSFTAWKIIIQSTLKFRSRKIQIIIKKKSPHSLTRLELFGVYQKRHCYVYWWPHHTHTQSAGCARTWVHG